MVSIDQFAAIDLRVGRIISVDELNTKKPMYKLEVDLGELGKRNIAAGIKAYYTKEELINKFIIVVANLDPKKIGDIFISEGMVLATEDANGVSLITPERNMLPGSSVR